MMGWLASAIGRAALRPFAQALPPLGDTERAALEAGTVGFEGQLFAGRPDIRALMEVRPQPFTNAEKRFLDYEVRELCGMLDDHAIDQAGDMPPEVWRFLREKRFSAWSSRPNMAAWALATRPLPTWSRELPPSTSPPQ
jgi:acyl-CoA dehydrogenase